MNYFERCKKRIEEGKKDITKMKAVAYEAFRVSGLLLERFTISGNYQVRFNNIIVPSLEEEEKAKLFYMTANYFHTTREILEKETLKDL